MIETLLFVMVIFGIGNTIRFFIENWRGTIP